MSFEDDVQAGERFEFGRNWQQFLTLLSEERIAEAEASIRSMLGLDSLEGKSFLDIGSGSGLFSLAAMRLAAQKVHSFDFDPQSVACGRELKRRYFPNNDQWTVEQGSALDANYLSALGRWDVVYSWGVLHHTGDMWQALENVHSLVKPNGRLFISLYNDQGLVSRVWLAVKRIYNKGLLGRALITAIFVPLFILRGLFKDLLLLRNPLRRYREYKKSRGMSVWHDWLDWLGGYPFEVSRPEEIFNFFYSRGFELQQLVTRGSGCNEYVFLRK